MSVWFEPDAAIEVTRCRIAGVVDDLDSFCAHAGEQFDSSGEHVPRQSSPLVVVLGSHRFDETGGRHGVVPEQPVRRDAAVPIVNHQVEVRAIQRRLSETLLDVGVIPLGARHVVRTAHRVGASRQPIALRDGADLGAGIGRQPRLDRSVLFDPESVAEQHTTQNVVGAIHFEVDLVDTALGSVSKPSADDVRDLRGCCAGHEHRVEANTLCRVGRDGGRCGFTVIVEPEQLWELVSRSGSTP